jgi:hypothetical protein
MQVPSSIERSIAISRKLRESELNSSIDENDVVYKINLKSVKNDIIKLLNENKNEKKITATYRGNASKHLDTIFIGARTSMEIMLCGYNVSFRWNCDKCSYEGDFEYKGNYKKCKRNNHQIIYCISVSCITNTDDGFDKAEEDNCVICLEKVYKKLQVTSSCKVCKKTIHSPCRVMMTHKKECPSCRGELKI